MNPRAPLSPRLLEALSAYLDGRLDGAEKAALEESLARDENLRLHLAELRAVRESLRALPPIQPPRPLTLTRALAGEPERRSDRFSYRSLAFGSALAALAFVFVLSVNVLSGISLGAAAPQFESFAAPARLQSADQAAPTGGKASAPTAAPQPTLALPAGTAAGPRETLGGGESPAPTGTPAPAESVSDGCPEPPGANKAAERCGLTFEETAPTSFSKPDFQTLAPYIELFLGSAAIVLAALAVWARRKNRR